MNLNRKFDHIVQRFKFIYRDHRILDLIIQFFIKMKCENNVVLTHFIQKRFKL